MSTYRRSPEIDIARVFAISLMVAFHIAYDLSVYYNWNINVFSGAWWLIGKVSAITFLFLSGMSFSISWARTPQWKKYVRRGAVILFYGFLITLTTYVLNSSTYVRFGILHLIGISIMILPLIMKLRYWSAILGVVAIVIGMSIQKIQGSSATLILGLRPDSFVSIDYFPLFPWIGVIIFGSVFGRLYHQQECPTFFRSNPTWLLIFTYLSKKSLLIYLVHQPLIILVLWLILGKPT